MMDDLTDEEREALERLALDAIKAIHKTGGRPVTNAEKIEFMETPRRLFNGDELVDERTPGKRGPPPKKVTRYRLLAERMRGDYHRLIRRPRSGGRARMGDTPVPAAVAPVAENLNLADLPEKARVGAVRLKLERKGLHFDDKAIRDALRALGLYRGKTTPD